MQTYYLKAVVSVEAESWEEAQAIMIKRLAESNGMIRVNGFEKEAVEY